MKRRQTDPAGEHRAALHEALKTIFKVSIEETQTVLTETVYAQASVGLLLHCRELRLMYQTDEENDLVKLVKRYMVANVPAYSGSAKYAYVDAVARQVRMALCMQGGRGSYKRRKCVGLKGLTEDNFLNECEFV